MLSYEYPSPIKPRSPIKGAYFITTNTIGIFTMINVVFRKDAISVPSYPNTESPSWYYN